MKETIVVYQDDEGYVEVKVKPKTRHTTTLLAIEMLIECLLEATNYDIDKVLNDVKNIYIRDNKQKEPK